VRVNESAARRSVAAACLKVVLDSKNAEHLQAMASVPWNYGDGALAGEAREEATASLSP
jgi:hypothetical protein